MSGDKQTIDTKGVWVVFDPIYGAFLGPKHALDFLSRAQRFTSKEEAERAARCSTYPDLIAITLTEAEAT